MKSCFGSCRSIISVFFCILLFIFILIGIPLLSLSLVLTNPENIKSTLVEVNIYEEVYNVALDVSSKNEDIDFIEKIDKSEEEIKTSLKKIITPDWLKQNVENIIDSVYIWLDSGTQIPEFTVDLSEVETNAINEGSTFLIDYIEDLPDCSQEEMQSMQSESFNPFDMSCKPADFDTASFEDEFKIKMEEELNKNETFEKEEFNSSEVIKLDTEIVEKIQKGYSIFKKVPIIVAVCILVTTILIFLLMPGLSNKFLASGIGLVLSSALLLFGNFFINNNFTSIFNDQIQKLDDIKKEESIVNLAQNLVRSLLDAWLHFIRQYSLVIVIVGLILFIGGIILKFTKKKYYIEDDSEGDKQDSRESAKKEKRIQEEEKSTPEVRLK